MHIPRITRNTYNRVLSISIKKHSIQLFELSKSAHRKYQVNNYSCIDCEDVLIDSQHYIIDPSNTATLIKECLDRNQFTANCMASSIPEQHIMQHEIYVDSALHEIDILSMIKRDIGDYIPLPTEEIVFDFHVAPHVNVPKQKKKLVGIYACRKKYFEQYQILSQFLALELMSISSTRQVKQLAMHYIAEQISSITRLNVILFIDFQKDSYKITIIDVANYTLSSSDECNLSAQTHASQKWDFWSIIINEVEQIINDLYNKIDIIVLAGKKEDINLEKLTKIPVPVITAQPFIGMKLGGFVDTKNLLHDPVELLTLCGNAFSVLNR